MWQAFCVIDELQCTCTGIHSNNLQQSLSEQTWGSILVAVAEMLCKKENKASELHTILKILMHKCEMVCVHGYSCTVLL